MAQTRKRTNGRRPNKKGKRTVKQNGGGDEDKETRFARFGRMTRKIRPGNLGIVEKLKTGTRKVKDTAKNVSRKAAHTASSAVKSVGRAAQHLHGHAAHGEIKEFTGYDTEKVQFKSFNEMKNLNEFNGKTLGKWDNDYKFMTILGELSYDSNNYVLKLINKGDAKTVLTRSEVNPNYQKKYFYIIKNVDGIEPHHKTLNLMNEALKLYNESEPVLTQNNEVKKKI